MRAALAHPAQFRLMFGPLLARKAEHPKACGARPNARSPCCWRQSTRHAPERGLEIALAGWSLSHGAANLAIDGAFGGLPIAPAQARRLARLDAGALVRGMVAGLLQAARSRLPSRARSRKTRRTIHPVSAPASVQSPSAPTRNRR